MPIRITLFCNAGMSTSLLVTNMRKQAKVQGKDYDINAYGLATVDVHGPGSDLILVGPQVRFALNNVRSKCPGVRCEAIDMRAYGMMDAKSILATAEQYLHEEGKL